MATESKLEYVVIVTSKGMYDCILDCGIVESIEAANKAIHESKEKDVREGWQYEYRCVPVMRANGICVQLTGGHLASIADGF